MKPTVVVTTSYPRHRGDAEGHFVGAEVRRLVEHGQDVTVLAPGSGRASLWGEQVVSCGGEGAFGFPGALERLRDDPRNVVRASRFVWSAMAWLRGAPQVQHIVAHFLLPCGVPIATRAAASRQVELEVVVHGSDARLFARLPLGHGQVGRELLRANARLRFVSSELRELLLARLPVAEGAALAQRSRVEPAAIDVDGVPARSVARAQLGIDPGEKLAAIVARLVPGKRVEVALEACERVRGLRCVVLGDGPELPKLKQRFPRATFPGHVERPLALTYISAADVLVSASLQEGAPSVVREARALGTTVVCLAAGDVARWAETDPGINVIGA